MYLFFDTETTGLPRNWNAPVSDLGNWPRLVQIAWLLYDADGRKVLGQDYIIKPQGFTIPRDAARIHGITTEKAEKNGISLRSVLEDFSGSIGRARYLVAHNVRFDEKIVGAEFLREGVTDKLCQTKKICTMTATTHFCKLPGNYGDYKWPKLSELHFKLFNEEFAEAHNAVVDIEACAKCFWELRRRGIL
ncbi:MAG: 3'-5' exonuclease [Thermodesulfovibrionales bacterium]